MQETRTDEACKGIIRMLARKLGISPASLISTRLLSEDDKNHMRSGVLSVDVLELHIKVWRDKGMRDLVSHANRERII